LKDVVDYEAQIDRINNSVRVKVEIQIVCAYSYGHTQRIYVQIVAYPISVHVSKNVNADLGQLMPAKKFPNHFIRTNVLIDYSGPVWPIYGTTWPGMSSAIDLEMNHLGCSLISKEATDIPVKFVGVGETLDDIEPFDPKAFVEALFSQDG
jgi:hypothetical protein